MLPVTKRCTRCGVEYPATEDFFSPDKRKPGRVISICKSCRRETSRLYREKNPEKVKERFHRYYHNNVDAMRARRRRYYVENREAERASARRYYEANQDKERERIRRYYHANRDKEREYNRRYRIENMEREHERGRQYYAENVEKLREKNRRYRAENPEKIRELNRRWQANNLDKVALNARRRHARKLALPDTLTQEQWLNALEYWQRCCAYCGKQANKLMIEHYVPLTNPACPGTVATNIVPACGSCNISKGKRDAVEWLVWKFGETRAHEIQSRILAYFQSIRLDKAKG